LRVSNGKIEDLRIESIYNLDGSLSTGFAAPSPFQPDIKEWGLRDVNWFADFPTSAKKMLEFYETAKETADGMMAFTPKVFEDLLSLTGPIKMPDYGVVLDSQNFQEIVQFKTSVDYDKTLNQPKKMLSDFAGLLLDRMQTLTQDQWVSILGVFDRAFLEKNILAYSVDGSVQSKIERLGFSGNVKEAPQDYLMVLSENHSGTKTDLKTIGKIGIEISIEPDGSVFNRLKITRENFSDETNDSFIRILVPLGSELIYARGFNDTQVQRSESEGLKTDPLLKEWDEGYFVGNVFVTQESGKTEYAGWSETLPGGKKDLEIYYKLPFSVKRGFNQNNSYSMLFQKQPGAIKTGLEGVVKFKSLRTVWNTNNIFVKGNTAKFSSKASMDEFWSLTFED
jgi:hypothetical protein